MAKWWLKAVVQKAISFLPYKEQVNFFFQKYVTRGVDLDDRHFRYKLEAARDHLKYYARYGTVPPAEAMALELGTGWYPIVPALLFLAGFREVVSVDIRSWMNRERQLIALRRILDYHDSGRLQPYLSDPRPDRLATLRELCGPAGDTLNQAEISARLHLRALVMDATRLDFPDDHFDFICSNNTFEHVHAPVLRSILAEFRRVWKPDGVMSHFIDLSDHFAHLDAGIDIYHFLRYSDRQWARIDNDIQPQNRLRWRDYRDLYTDLGIPVREEEVVAGDAGAVRATSVSDAFSGYTAEELAISHGYLVS
ncbi:class I SAM-dependent methyltransferase [Lewinella sp. IMCC34183]|uniref:class I SAM-dependent methyltransferase n=1 Tax=Lewinella sp. IMCC34183 TaxID=2248762 RepID=UPI000E26265A|nr:class I SAM-dependent methyltransferase [Lewinella sp. IMCC34183]